MKDSFVTHREALAGVIVLLALSGSFGYWLVGEARGATATAKDAQEAINTRVAQQLNRIEDGVEQIRQYLLGAK